VQEPGAKRARLRAACAAHVAAEGLWGLNLHRIAAEAGTKFEIARWHYRTNAALLIDVVKDFQASVGEAMADAVLAARARPCGAERVRVLAAGYLEAAIALRAGALTARAACAAVPEVALAVRTGGEWLVGEFAAALGGGVEAEVKARTLVWVLGEWGFVVEEAEVGRVGGVVAGMMG
jgi:hypothetical protein